MLQFERFDKAMESKPVDWIFPGEQRSQRVQNITIRAETPLNDAACISGFALKPQSRDVLD
jgi:hypothetical protein